MCGAWRGSLGNEATPEEYVRHIVQIFAEVKRVLRHDGTVWLNLGDSMWNSDGYARANKQWHRENRDNAAANDRKLPYHPFLKVKDLVGIPWRVAFALQADGWYLRSDIVWAKPNAMPEPVRDRPTRSHEFVFLLSKSSVYYYDNEAIKEVATTTTWPGIGPQHAKERRRKEKYEEMEALPKKNKRDVWTVPTGGYKGSHSAVFPPNLIEPMILAGSSSGGVCPHCGEPWDPVVEKTGQVLSAWSEKGTGNYDMDLNERESVEREGDEKSTLKHINVTRLAGYEQSCDCEESPSIPATVLDPFFGAGTTGLVSDRLGRDCIGMELNPEYAMNAYERLLSDNPLFTDVSLITEGE